MGTSGGSALGKSMSGPDSEVSWDSFLLNDWLLISIGIGREIRNLR